ncbi:MAG: tetratricopeptide repeat protein [Candidatus Hodarchaeales archaeon]|jgi:tetratricopeptide (TPR) repeat protein
MTKSIKDLFEQGRYQEVLDQFDQLKTQGVFTSFMENEQIECIVYYSFALQTLGQTEQGLQVATTARTKIQETDNISLLLALLSAEVRALLELRQMDDAHTLITEGDVLLKKLPVIDQEPGSFWIHLFKLTKGNFLTVKDKTDLALDHLRQALAGFEKLDTPNYIAETILSIGEFYYSKGEYDTALEYLQRSFTLYERLDHKSGLKLSSLLIGHSNMHKGEYDTMLEYYQRSVTSVEESGSPFQIAYPLNCVGLAYALRSKLDIALEYCQRALTLAETTGSKRTIAGVALTNGMIYYMKGELDNSLNCLQRSLTLNEAIEYDSQVAIVLYYLILLMIDRKELPQAQSYLTYLQKINTRSPSKQTQNRVHLAEALVLKQSPRMVNKAQAQTILKQIVTEETFKWRWDQAMLGLFHLCELLIFESKATGEAEVWEEAKTLVNQIYTKAQNKKKFIYIGEALLLKAKIAMIEGELQQAFTYLDQTKTVATENDIILLKDKVEVERKRLDADLGKWNELIRNNASLQKRFQQAHLEEYLQKAQQAITHLSLN